MDVLTAPSPFAEDAEVLLPEIVALRRAIHAEPEIGLQTPLTRDKVLAALDGLPLEIRQGPSTTGVIAVLHGAHNGRKVLLRGDTDALPMQEETGLDFASKVPGAMHACGHDSHTAMLVGAARMLCARRDSLAGTVIFMFQPGEEGYHGAKHMIDDGLLDDPAPDAAFALHVMPNAPHGAVLGRAGPLLASADKVKIWVTGSGGHASMPHDARDPVPVACEIVTAMHTFVTRQVPIGDPAVVTIGKIEAGTTDNVIPDTAFLFGTMRALSAETRAKVQAGLVRLAEGIAAAHGLSARVEFVPGYPVTNCDPRAVALGSDMAKAMFGDAAWQPMPTPIMGAEDFSYVLQKVPGAMFFLGAAEDGADWKTAEVLHSTRMVIDERAMARGAALHAAIAERFLAEGFPGD